MAYYQKISSQKRENTDIIKVYLTPKYKQRYPYRLSNCDKNNFLTDYAYKAYFWR